MIYEDKQPKSIGDVFRLSGKPNRANEQSKLSSSKKGPNSERASLIGRITDEINIDRNGKTYKKLSYAAIGYKLAHIKTKDLYYIIKVCEDSNNFAKKFWYLINPKKHT